MKKCYLKIQDEVNCRFDGLDVAARRKLSELSKFFIQSARHTPAFKLGRWDGKIAFCDLAGRTYLNFIDRLIPTIIDMGYELEIEDEREYMDLNFEQINADSYNVHLWPADHPTSPLQPIQLRDHQVDYINTFLSSPQGVGVAPTGSGKTIVTAVLADKIGKYGRSIIIVPTKDLVTQTERDFRLLGLDVGVYYGDRKEYGHQHTICTWQSLEVIIKRGKNRGPGVSITEFINGVKGVIVDETHKCKGNVLRAMLTDHFANVPIRWGLTGTIPKEDWEAITLEVSIGQVLGRITAKELQEKGILANLHINVMQLVDPDWYSGNYQSEYAYLTTNQDRLKYIAKEVQKISQTGNTLILVDRIKSGEKLQAMIPDSVFVSGKVKSSDRKEEYDEVKTSTNKVIIATFGVASTGIDLPRIFNLILLEPGKSFVRVIQSIGRGIRIAKDKDFVNVFDLCSSAKFSKKHLTERKKFYKESAYPFTINKIAWS